MLRNQRGAVSLRWLRALLDNGIEVHGQVVVCPGVNDGAVLDATLAGILDRYPDLATAAVVPLGISRYSTETSLNPHTREQAAAVVDLVQSWQETFRASLGRRLVFLADEYFLMAGRPFPDAEHYEGFPQHENGIGMAAAFSWLNAYSPYVSWLSNRYAGSDFSVFLGLFVAGLAYWLLAGRSVRRDAAATA